MPQVAIAGAGLAVAAVGTAASLKNQKKSLKQQAVAQRYERQKNELQNARQKMEVVRATRQSLANASQAAVNQGVADSSAALGGQGSIQSQGSGNLSFLDRFGFYSDQASAALGKANAASGTASMWGAIAGIGMQAHNISGGFGKGSKETVGPPPPPVTPKR